MNEVGDTEPIAHRRDHRRPRGRLLIPTAIVVSAAVVVALLWHENRESVTGEWCQRLDALARDRAVGVARWLNDHRRTAAMVATYPTVHALLGRSPANDKPYPEDLGAARHLEDIFAPLIAEPEVLAVVVRDATGATAFAVPPGTDVGGGAGPGAGGWPRYAMWQSTRPRGTVVVQVPVEDAGAAIGSVAIFLDPAVWLDGFVTARDDPGRSCEVYLVDRDPAGPRVLSPLRFAELPQLPGRLPPPALEWLAELETEHPAVQRVADYRGVPVLSAPRRIAGGSWWALAEVDRSEVLADVRRATLVAAVAVLAPALLVAGVIGAVWQSRRRQLLERLSHSEALYRRIVETTGEAVVTTDADGVVTYANRRLGEMVGIPPQAAIGRRFAELAPVELVGEISRRFARRREGGVDAYELQGQRPDGSDLAVWVHATPLLDDHGRFQGGLAMLSDVTELKATQAHLLRAQKLEAVGRLAASVAHDFNNVLQIVIGSVQLLRLRLGDRPGDQAALERLEQQVERGARITRQLLMFAREQPPSTARFDLREPVESVATLLRTLLKEDVTIELRLGAEPVPVVGDPVHVDQIITNLAVNGADAMPLGGVLTIAVERSAGTATIRVADTGDGVPETIRDRLFEPFFTTKEASRGTGLGLAIVRQLARAQGGDVVLARSVVGQGTEFAVTLPLAPDAATEGGEAPLPTTIQRGDGEVVLLVEDDPATRDSVSELLREIDYRVRAVATFGEARSALGEGGVDLVVTDMILPDGRGESLLDEIDRLPQPIPVVFVSGYSESDTLVRRVAEQTVHYLRKPVGVAELAATIHAALAG